MECNGVEWGVIGVERSGVEKWSGVEWSGMEWSGVEGGGVGWSKVGWTGVSGVEWILPLLPPFLPSSFLSPLPHVQGRSNPEHGGGSLALMPERSLTARLDPLWLERVSKHDQDMLAIVKDSEYSRLRPLIKQAWAADGDLPSPTYCLSTSIYYKCV